MIMKMFKGMKKAGCVKGAGILLALCMCVLTACGEEGREQTGLEDLVHDMGSLNGSDGAGGEDSVGELSELPSAYNAFLWEHTEITVADWFQADMGYSAMGDIQPGETYTLTELVDFVTGEVYEERFGKSYTWDLQYALLDCGGDGEPELAVRINNVGIDGPEDGSTTTLVLKEIDGTLYLCDSFDTWSRSDSTLYYYGYRQDGGSCGAGDHIYCEKLLDGQGKPHEIYSCETLTGVFYMAYINAEAVSAYNEIYGEEYPGLYMNLYEVDGQEYVVYVFDEDYRDAKKEAFQEELAAEFIRLFEENGTEFTDKAVITEKISDYKKQLGIAEEWCVQKNLEWKRLDAAVEGGGGASGGQGATASAAAIFEGQILEQSFEVELDGWGKVTFAAFEPEEVSASGIWAYGDARFMLLKDDQVLYTFPGYYSNPDTGTENIMSGQQFGQVLSVAFKDYNEDGRKDILLILEYAGVQGIDIGQTWREARAYTQEEGEKEFHVDKLLTEQLRYYSENMEQVYEGIEAYSKGYAVCTDLGTWEVERFAKRVRKQVLAGDYERIAEELAYPVVIDGVTYADKAAFLAADFVKNPNPAFVEAMEQETGELLFCNWQGIMLGSGGENLWFAEVLNDDGSSQGLKITGINGITANTEAPSSWEQTEALISERLPYYQASSFHDEIVDYWENTREVRDVSNVIEPLYETDKRYLTKENLAYDPPLVIHLAKNEIYARHGYIFKDADLYNYFMGCIWYTPSVEPEAFSEDVFNAYEKENLKLLTELDTYDRDAE